MLIESVQAMPPGLASGPGTSRPGPSKHSTEASRFVQKRDEAAATKAGGAED